MNRKALSLLSGGLDSILATRLVRDQGIDIEAVHYSIGFACSKKPIPSALHRTAERLKVPLTVFDVAEEFLGVVKDPRHGYGANINPCIDCKIFMLKKAKEYLAQAGASFVITGEVLGERPMSQRRDTLMLIERESGLPGLILRPLSASLLPETLPEKEGVVDRSRLLGIRGRSRKPQIALARQFGIDEYPAPAGGCLLTDQGFTARMKDLIASGSFTRDNIELLKVGRHFRLSPGLKFVVGRDEAENSALLGLAGKDDMLFEVEDVPGPLALLRGEGKDAFLREAAEIVAYHTKARDNPSLTVSFWLYPHNEKQFLKVTPSKRECIDSKRI